MSRPGFRGCPMSNTAVEFPEAGHIGRRVVETCKAETRERVLGMTRRLPVEDPEVLADGLMLLIEGAYSIHHVFGSQVPPRPDQVRRAADRSASEARVTPKAPGVAMRPSPACRGRPALIGFILPRTSASAAPGSGPNRSISYPGRTGRCIDLACGLHRSDLCRWEVRLQNECLERAHCGRRSCLWDLQATSSIK